MLQRITDSRGLFQPLFIPPILAYGDSIETTEHKETTEMNTVAQVAKFFAHNPTQLGTVGEYKLWEHPTRGDSAPVYMTTPDGRLLNTGFYDIGDFDIELCVELDKVIA